MPNFLPQFKVGPAPYLALPGAPPVHRPNYNMRPAEPSILSDHLYETCARGV